RLAGASALVIQGQSRVRIDLIPFFTPLLYKLIRCYLAFSLDGGLLFRLQLCDCLRRVKLLRGGNRSPFLFPFLLPISYRRWFHSCPAYLFSPFVNGPPIMLYGRRALSLLFFPRLPLHALALFPVALLFRKPFLLYTLLRPAQLLHLFFP